MISSKILIFDFADYKLYLKNYYEFNKKRDAKFSYRYFSMKTGVSPNMLPDIISGRRKLTFPIMEKYAKFLKLNSKERRYFELMIKFQNATSINVKNEHFSEMARLRGNSKISFIGAEQYEFYNQWYHAVIREMITLSSYDGDNAKLARSMFPHITEEQVSESIKFLCDINLLVREKNGELKQTDAVISSEYEIASLALKKFHMQMINIASDAIEIIPKEFREISSLTLAVSTECYDQMKERIRHFKEEMLALVTDDHREADTVCQMNFQLYPFYSPRTIGGDND